MTTFDTDPTPPPAGDWRYIQSKAQDSGKLIVIDISGGGQAPEPGTKCVSAAKAATPVESQLWTFLTNGMIQSKVTTDPYLVMTVSNSDHLVVVAPAKFDDGTPDPSQVWVVHPVSGSNVITNQLTNLRLDIRGGGYIGKDIDVYSDTGGNNQLWMLPSS